MDDKTLANNVQHGIEVLNGAIKAAIEAGLIVEVKEAPSMLCVGDQPRQQFAATVARPL